MPALLDFTRYPLGVNLTVFALAAALVWFAGARLSRYADRISDATGIGEVLLGLVLLAWIGSLPELAVSVTSAAAGNAPLAVNNLLGGVAMQVAILAVADAAIGRRALTSVVASPTVLLQGSLNVILLSMVAAGTVVGSAAVLGISVWSWALLIVYAASVALVGRAGDRRQWIARGLDRPRLAPVESRRDSAAGGTPALRTLLTRTVLAAATILVAGAVLSRSAEAIAEETGLGSSFFGAAVLAISTSLPEVSIVVAAARLGRYEMAIADIFGANLLDTTLVFVVDAVYAGGSVLAEVGRFSTFAALLGIAVTALFLAGLVERRDRTVLRMGVDSLAVLLVYLGGLAVLYGLREGTG